MSREPERFLPPGSGRGNLLGQAADDKRQSRHDERRMGEHPQDRGGPEQGHSGRMKAPQILLQEGVGGQCEEDRRRIAARLGEVQQQGIGSPGQNDARQGFPGTPMPSRDVTNQEHAADS